MSDNLVIGGVSFSNRLFTGTGKFAAHSQIPEMLEASGSQMITVALRRIDLSGKAENVLDFIPDTVTLLPNTSGARTAEQAVRIARIAREAGCGDFIKIERPRPWRLKDLPCCPTYCPTFLLPSGLKG